MLWNCKVHYRIHNSLPPVPTVNHISPVHVPILFLQDPTSRYFSISAHSPSIRFPLKSPVCNSTSPNVPHAQLISLLHLCSYREMINYLLCTNIHLAVCLTTGPKPLPNRALHIVRTRASSFKCEYPLLSLRSSSSFLRFLPRLPVTSMPPFIFPSITRCRRQFLRKM